MSLKKIAKWAVRRLKERSTYVGLATVAATFGASKLGVQIDQIGQIVGIVTGTGLIAATTSVHPDLDGLL